MDFFQQIDISVFYVFIYFSFKKLYVLLGIADFFFIYFYQLENNYFTILQWFLPYTDMNQPWIYMCSPSRSLFLFFNTLSTFVIAFLPRSKCLLISWLQSPSAVILKPKKIKSVTASTFHPSICHEVMGPNAHLVFDLSFF